MIAPYSTMTFQDIYPDKDTFMADYGEDIEKTITDKNCGMLFYLMTAKFGCNPIANDSLPMFKYKFWTIVWQYGPTWEKKLEIQKKLRDLSEAELMAGAKQISNHALNPANDPSTGSLEELEFINEQSTSSYKRSKIEAYAQLWGLLRTEVTEEFISRFTSLFKMFAMPERGIRYDQED